MENDEFLLLLSLIPCMAIFVITGNVYASTLTFGIAFLLLHYFKLHKLIQGRLNQGKPHYTKLPEGNTFPKVNIVMVTYTPFNKRKYIIILRSIFYADILLIIASALGFGLSTFSINNETLMLSALCFWLFSIILFFILLVYTLHWYFFSE